MSAGWEIVDKSKISQSCLKNHLAAIIGRDLSDNHDSRDEDGDDENLVAIMGTDLRGGVS